MLPAQLILPPRKQVGATVYNHGLLSAWWSSAGDNCSGSTAGRL